MKVNYRRCISCRCINHKDKFWRIVKVYLSQTVQLDKGMGRSVYLCPKKACLAVASQKNRLERGLKTSIPQNIYKKLWERLENESI
ncbi:YlxR family protein [Candidatus Atelocyanobacterium thalassae]|jgi:predicted RNA-binding protein YlxR (DUF448 family)|uniref:Predicted nucleic-acid-binding protein implicated in transcription termination n=1 Tax=Atelocyanobacterium thalassa (isolate ALOHA) TaxID=1453429 RepID=D3EPL9_ATETH|nr:YlxR family protein [Candidatus Atelocyanobacterium thalassa]ADB95419.1 predicted nucleic-acid-binding protein implicated in transcription termination [Candidatus Atelocyanobacterium thalassa isolate ALOHA]MCH2543562.1 YlxR family protein [Candidatus Atelocyanobacterium sp. ALOHA_A2.5_9]|tara:strand:- start:426 stop:683 length:258 start_codon:yes stop_codon:yes gene_type:complete